MRTAAVVVAALGCGVLLAVAYRRVLRVDGAIRAAWGMAWGLFFLVLTFGVVVELAVALSVHRRTAVNASVLGVACGGVAHFLRYRHTYKRGRDMRDLLSKRD